MRIGAAGADVAKVLSRKARYNVELVDIDEFEQFRDQSGDGDATLEIGLPVTLGLQAVHQSGAGVVDGGELGVIGQMLVGSTCSSTRTPNSRPTKV